MAVNKTGAMFKSLTFDGEDSRDYGVYITGQAVFNAPEREVEMISIPGRNGQFALDKGRFENIEVTYPAGIFANTEADFAEAVSNFRNLLCSKRGYVRLQDEYHPDEYRMAIYKSGLELENVALKAGEFEITFDCKPQRYLTSGEEEITVGGWGPITTESGDLVEINNPDGNLEVKALSISLEPIQSGTGTPSPENVRTISGYTDVDVIVSPTLLEADGQTYTSTLPETVYGGTLDFMTGEMTVNMEMADTTTLAGLSWNSGAVNGNTGMIRFMVSISKAVGFSNVISNIFQTKQGAVASDYDNYESISGYSTNSILYVVVSSSRLTGDLSSTEGRRAAFQSWLSDNSAQVAYEPSSSRTVQGTTQTILLLPGVNNVWSDGSFTIEYAQNLNEIYNPTLFDAEPLLEVEGYGHILFNDYNINLENATMGEVEIVSNETMTQTSFDPGTETTVSESQAIPISDYANVGDDFTASFNITEPLSGFSIKSVKSATISTPSSNGSASVSFSGKNVSVKINGAGLSGTTNADAQTTASCTASVVYVNNLDATLTATISISVTLDYDATSQKTTVTSDINRSGGGFVTLGDTVAVLSSFVVDSTVSILGHPTYIDCELGECYRIENGTVISLNRYIDLGSDLPKLAPGGNEFTIDNTITELKVVPKWWKV